MINGIPGRTPDRWKEPISEARFILNQILTNLTTMADSAETLVHMTKQLFSLGICSIYEILDAEFYYNLSKQCMRVYCSIKNIKFSDLCNGGSEFHHAKARWLKERELKYKQK